MVVNKPRVSKSYLTMIPVEYSKTGYVIRAVNVSIKNVSVAIKERSIRSNGIHQAIIDKWDEVVTMKDSKTREIELNNLEYIIRRL